MATKKKGGLGKGLGKGLDSLIPVNDMVSETSAENQPGAWYYRYHHHPSDVCY